MTRLGARPILARSPPRLPGPLVGHAGSQRTGASHACLPGPIRQAEFQAVQRARCCQCMATVPLPGPPLAVHVIDAAGQGRVVKQTIMIVEIVVTQGQGEDVLYQQRLHIVFDASGVTTID